MLSYIFLSLYNKFSKNVDNIKEYFIDISNVHNASEFLNILDNSSNIRNERYLFLYYINMSRKYALNYKFFLKIFSNISLKNNHVYFAVINNRMIIILDTYNKLSYFIISRGYLRYLVIFKMLLYVIKNYVRNLIVVSYTSKNFNVITMEKKVNTNILSDVYKFVSIKYKVYNFIDNFFYGIIKFLSFDKKVGKSFYLIDNYLSSNLITNLTFSFSDNSVSFSKEVGNLYSFEICFCTKNDFLLVLCPHTIFFNLELYLSLLNKSLIHFRRLFQDFYKNFRNSVRNVFFIYYNNVGLAVKYFNLFLKIFRDTYVNCFIVKIGNNREKVLLPKVSLIYNLENEKFEINIYKIELLKHYDKSLFNLYYTFLKNFFSKNKINKIKFYADFDEDTCMVDVFFEHKNIYLKFYHKYRNYLIYYFPFIYKISNDTNTKLLVSF